MDSAVTHVANDNANHVTQQYYLNIGTIYNQTVFEINLFVRESHALIKDPIGMSRNC